MMSMKRICEMVLERKNREGNSDETEKIKALKPKE
jgi:hypothetical protein